MVVNRYFVALAGVWTLTVLVGFAWQSLQARSPHGCQVRVLTYSSMISSWGAGPPLAEAFAREQNCGIEWLNGGEAGLLIEKTSLLRPDVVMGIDDFQWRQSKEFWRSSVDYDWSAITWIFRKGDVHPSHLDDFLKPEFNKKFVLPDPRFSSPGLQYVMWVLDQKGWDAGWAYLAEIKRRAFAVGSSWSAAYGLFQKGQADLALSYVTSPLYHWFEEKDLRYEALSFDQGLPVQKEYAAIPKQNSPSDISDKFLQFIVSPTAQEIFLKKNYMFPSLRTLPVDAKVTELMKFQPYKWQNLDELENRKSEIFEKWQEL